ncbi:MAG: 50S ribosomal protein L11 methyltransferase, partial [Actinomycetota bacterium]
ADDGADEMVSSLLWDAGTTGIVEIDGQLLAGFDDRATADAVIEQAVGWPVEVIGVEQATWAGGDETTTVTIAAEPDGPGQPGPSEQSGGSARTLSIVAGPTFGHGAHPTTALAIDLVTGAIRGRLADPAAVRPSVLDVGTGSGVLAIVAAALGASPVVGVDNDPAAIPVARGNGERNGVELIVSDATVDRTPDLVDGARFDLVVANVLVPVQRELAVAMAAVLADGGTLATTGYLEADGPSVIELHRSALAAAGRPVARVEMVGPADGWIGHRFDLG